MVSQLHLAIGMPGPFELMIVLIIALLIFGRRLPEVMRGLGRSVTEFKRGMNDITTLEEDPNEPPQAADPKAEQAENGEKPAEKNIG